MTKDSNSIACLACPPGCLSCSQDESDCECYEHAHLHPRNEPELPEGMDRGLEWEATHE